MSIIAKKLSSDLPPREPVPEGTHVARCYQIIHLGHLTSEYQGKELVRDRIWITFELPTEMRSFKEGEPEKPMSISEEYTLSLDEKSKLRPLLEAWRGKKFTEDELEGFAIDKLLGAPALVSVVHDSKGDRTYANIGGVTKVIKGMDIPEQVNPSRILDFEDWNQELFDSLPQFLKDKITSSREYDQRMNGSISETDGEINIDDIPF